MADASSKAGKFPQLEGFKGSLHSLAHDWNKPNGAENLGKWDRFMTEQLTYFLSRLAETEEAGSSLLNRSLVFYGSSNSQTHNNSNYPLVLAGGGDLGMNHGQFLTVPDTIPLSNLFATILSRLGVQHQGFADSTGEFTDVVPDHLPLAAGRQQRGRRGPVSYRAIPIRGKVREVHVPVKGRDPRRHRDGPVRGGG